MWAANLPNMATNPRPISELTKSVVAEIRAIRKRLDISQEDLANKSGIPLPTLGKIERLERPLGLEQIGVIAEALDMTEDELLAEARRTRKKKAAANSAREVGSPITPQSSFKGRSTDEQQEKREKWAQGQQRPVRGQSTANPDQEAASTKDQ